MFVFAARAGVRLNRQKKERFMINLQEQVELREHELEQLEKYCVIERQNLDKLRRVLGKPNGRPKLATIERPEAPDIPAGYPPAPARDGTKAAKVIAMMKRPGGATVPEIIATTKWDPRTVRSFVSGAVKKKGYAVESTNRTPDGRRAYSIRG